MSPCYRRILLSTEYLERYPLWAVAQWSCQMDTNAFATWLWWFGAVLRTTSVEKTGGACWFGFSAQPGCVGGAISAYSTFFFLPVLNIKSKAFHWTTFLASQLFACGKALYEVALMVLRLSVLLRLPGIWDYRNGYHWIPWFLSWKIVYILKS